MLVLLLAHEGEEFVIILPAVMLLGAWLIMRWAGKDENSEDTVAEDGPDGRVVGLEQQPTGTEEAEEPETAEAR